jgi:hypothetical protein
MASLRKPMFFYRGTVSAVGILTRQQTGPHRNRGSILWYEEGELSSALNADKW